MNAPDSTPFSAMTAPRAGFSQPPVARTHWPAQRVRRDIGFRPSSLKHVKKPDHITPVNGAEK